MERLTVSGYAAIVSTSALYRRIRYGTSAEQVLDFSPAMPTMHTRGEKALRLLT